MPASARSLIEHCRVPHVLKRFPGQRRPTTRAAVQEDRLVFLESGVVKLALGVSPELQHAPRDVHSAFVWGDGLEDRAEGVADGIGGSAGGPSEPVLEL